MHRYWKLFVAINVNAKWNASEPWTLIYHNDNRDYCTHSLYYITTWIHVFVLHTNFDLIGVNKQLIMIIDVNEMNGDDPNEIEHNHFFLMIFH